MRHSEGSRDELPEAVSGSPSARIVPHGCEADRRGPWKRSVRGLLGETGRLGLARPGSAAEGRGDGRLLAWFLRAWSGPQAVSSVRRSAVAGGALTRGGLRLPIGRGLGRELQVVN